MIRETNRTFIIKPGEATHLPFHNYAGPGTPVYNNIIDGIKPTTTFDAISLVHDVEYIGYENRDIPDAQMVASIRKEYGDTLANQVKSVFKLDSLMNNRTQNDKNTYNQLKPLAVELLNKSGYAHIKFSDGN
jgi:hypothetical protein